MITLKEFIDKNPKQTLLSFAWSCHWRIAIAINLVLFGAWVGVVLVIAILNVAFGY